MLQSESVVREFWRLFSDQNWQESKALFHPAFIAEWPQSRERFRGGDAYVEMNREYPGTHRMEILQLAAIGDRVVSTVFIHAADTGQKAFATTWFEFEGGQILKMTEFWGEPYDPPANRLARAERY